MLGSKGGCCGNHPRHTGNLLSKRYCLTKVIKPVRVEVEECVSSSLTLLISAYRKR